MRYALFTLICLVSIAATCAVYGFFESAVNMAESIGLLFAPGSPVVFAPILLLFLALALAVFVVVPLLAVVAGAVLGGWALRKRALGVSRSLMWRFVVVAAFCHFAVVSIALWQDLPILRDRPREHPKSSLYLLAGIVAMTAGLNCYAAGAIIRKFAPRPPPLPARQTRTGCNAGVGSAVRA